MTLLNYHALFIPQVTTLMITENYKNEHVMSGMVICNLQQVVLSKIPVCYAHYYKLINSQ